MIYRFGQFELDDSARELRAGGRLVEAEPKAFDLLVHLIRHRDRAVSKDELLNEIWPQQIVTETALTRAIMKARRAVGDDSNSQTVIRTIHGHGYRFVAELDPEPAGYAPTVVAPEAAAALLEDPVQPAGGRFSRRMQVLSGFALVAILFAAWFAWQQDSEPRSSGALAVLPVINLTDDTELSWVKAGLMSLMSRMLQDAGVGVASESAVLRAVGDDAPLKPPDAALFDRIRREAGADAVLHTVLERQGGLHRLAAVVTHADGRRTRRIIVGESPAVLAAELSAIVAGLIQTDSEPDKRRFRKVSTDPFINELYARALDLELQGEIAEARELFRVAATQEPELFWLRYEIALCTRDLEEYEEAQRMFEELTEEARAGADVQALVAVLNSHALMHVNLYQYDDAEPLLNEALDASAERSRARDRATVLTNLALIASRKGQVNLAREYYEQILEAHRQAGDDPSPFFLNNYAGLLMQLGDLDQAEVYSRQAVAEFQLRGQRRYLAPATNRLAKILRKQGDFDGALERTEQAAQIYRELGNTAGEISVQSGVTNLYRQQGDLTRARVNAIAVLERAEDLGEPFLVANSHLQVGYVEADAGRHELALPEFDAALTGFLKGDEAPAIRAVRTAIALSLIELGETADAGRIAAQLLETAIETEHDAAAASARLLQGTVLAETGDYVAAAQRLGQALDYARAAGNDSITANAAAALARVEIGRGNLGSASALLDEIRPLAGTDHDFLRIEAQLAVAQGDNTRAAEILTDLKQRAGEAWKTEDQALLATLDGAR